MKVLQSFLNRILIFLLVILLSLIGLPVLVLLFATAVPRWISLLLSVVHFGTMFAFGFGLLHPLMLIFMLLACSFMAVYLSQHFAKTPAIVDADGKPVVGSIATLEKVQLGDTSQWINIRGRDRKNPVLLWLAGGPGNSDIATVRAHLQALEAYFTVVVWDQPGSVKSYRARDIESLSPEHYLADAKALVLYLRERFGQEKIYLTGHSWGTFLGVWLAQRHPDYFHAYIGIAQGVNLIENDRIAYQFALDYLREQGKTKKLALVEKQGPPPYFGENVLVKYAQYMGEIAEHTKTKLKDESKDIYTRITLDSLLAGEYGIIDKINIYRSALSTFGKVTEKAIQLDLAKEVPALKIPVYFALGRWDMNCVYALAEAYFEMLDAPEKHLICFEDSGHLPHYEERDAFLAMMIDKVLGQGQTAS